jgi:hypothetical protein
VSERNGHSGNGQAPLDADEKTGPEDIGHRAPMFQGLQGGRPVDERAGHR